MYVHACDGWVMRQICLTLKMPRGLFPVEQLWRSLGIQILEVIFHGSLFLCTVGEVETVQFTWGWSIYVKRLKCTEVTSGGNDLVDRFQHFYNLISN